MKKLEKMTVKKLIKLLKKFDAESEVEISMGIRNCKYPFLRIFAKHIFDVNSRTGNITLCFDGESNGDITEDIVG